MWTIFEYQCRTCKFTHSSKVRQETMFMAEHHVYGTNHYIGILTKIDHSEVDLHPMISYKKRSSYNTTTNRFSLVDTRL